MRDYILTSSLKRQSKKLIVMIAQYFLFALKLVGDFNSNKLIFRMRPNQALPPKGEARRVFNKLTVGAEVR
jgi:hypothetical protein